MTEIDHSIVTDIGLTTIRVRGAVRVEPLAEALLHLAHQGPTLHLLWDFTSADLSTLRERQLSQLVFVARQHAHHRRGGKTAMLVGSDFDFGMARMIATLSDQHEQMVEYRIFRCADTATAWLEGRG